MQSRRARRPSRQGDGAVVISQRFTTIDRAIADYDQATTVDPTFFWPYFNRGRAWAAKGDNDRAFADYTEAIRLDPKDAVSYNNRCWARAVMGRELPQALADCNEALRLKPDYRNAFNSRGLVQLRFGALDRAVADYSAALDMEPKDANSLYGRGIAKIRSGDRSGGEADIAAAKAKKPSIADEFARYGVRADATATDKAAAAPAADCAQAETHWKSVEDIKSLAAYRDHLARFPNCAFATLAKARIEALKK